MIKVLGHRGVRQHKTVDENSVPAFDLAFKSSDGIETDAVISADKAVFLCHELRSINIPHLFSRSTSALKRHLNRASAKLAGTRRIDQMTAKEVDRLQLKKNAPLASLAALFTLAANYPGKTINIELKGHGALEPTLAEIDKAVAAGKISREQIILTSFDHAAIAKAKILAPDIKRGLIFARQDLRDKRMYPWLKGNLSRYDHLSGRTLRGKTAQEAAPDYFVMTGGALNARAIAKIRRYFPAAKIMIWTMKDPEHDKGLQKKLNNAALAPHIDTIISDFPDRMVKYLKNKGLRP